MYMGHAPCTPHSSLPTRTPPRRYEPTTLLPPPTSRTRVAFHPCTPAGQVPQSSAQVLRPTLPRCPGTTSRAYTASTSSNQTNKITDMNIPTKPLLSRKDIAALLVDVTPRQVVNNEKRLGLDKAKARLNGRVVFYRTAEVIAILRKRGLLPS
jgi:hypothetical protein